MLPAFTSLPTSSATVEALDSATLKVAPMPTRPMPAPAACWLAL